MENEQFKPIEETPKTTNQVNLPNLKQVQEPVNNNSDEIIKQLPEWNIEPPIEINRRQK